MTLFDHPERCHSSNFPRTSAANRSRRPPSHRLNQRRSPFITPEVLMSLLLVFMRSASLVNAQIGVTLCACQPVAYTFQLRFNNFCNQSNIEGPGVEDWDCKTTSSDSTATDFTPALITRAEVKELDQDQNVINFQNYAGPFFDGDTFTYVSIAANPSNVNSTTLPKGLQLSVYGRNIEEQDILNFWIILFTNECGLFPVLDPGEQIGWTDLVSLCFTEQSSKESLRWFLWKKISNSLNRHCKQSFTAWSSKTERYFVSCCIISTNVCPYNSNSNIGSYNSSNFITKTH